MIVFTTAYDEYAVQAFTVNSVDYLLKPIHKDRLVNAIRKCERLLSLHENSLSKLLDLEQLLRTIAEKKEKQFRTRFLISVPKHFYTIQVTEIAYFYSEDIVSVYRRTGLGIASSRKNYEAMQVLAEKLLEINRDTNFIFWKKIFSYINVISSYRIRKDNDNIVLDYKTKVLDSNKNEYKLKFIPFIKVIHSRTKIKYMLGKINIIKIKNKKNKNKIYLLGIPILKFAKKHLK